MKKIRTSRLGGKKGVLIKKSVIDYKLISADDTSQLVTKDKIQREIDRQVEANAEQEIDEN